VKKFFQNIGILGFSNILVFLVGLILLPILTKTLPIEDYGYYVLVIAAISLIPPIIMLGLPYTMIRYLAGEENRKLIQEGFYSIFCVILFISLITGFVLFSLSSTIAVLFFNGETAIVQFMSLILIFECLINLFSNYFRTFQKLKIYSIFFISQNYAKLVFILLALFLGLKIIGILLGILIADILISLIMFGLILSEIGIIVPNFQRIPTFLRFGLPTVPGNFSEWIVSLSNRYLIGIFLGVAFVGYFAPGYSLGFLVMSMLMIPFAVLLPAVLSQHFDQNNMEEVQKILQYSLKFFLFFAFPAFFGLTILSYPLIKLLTTPEIAEQGYIITGFAAFSALLYGIYTIIFQILILKKQTKIVGFNWIFAAILNFILNLILIPLFGLLGAGIASLLAYLSLTTIASYYSLKGFQLQFEVIYYIKIIFACILMSIVLLLLKPDGVISILIAIGLSIISYVAIMFGINAFSIEEIEFIKLNVPGIKEIISRFNSK